MPPHEQEVLTKAIDAWMDKKFALFGKWTASSLIALVFGLLCKWLFAHGISVQ